jgi:hypothetical protein
MVHGLPDEWHERVLVAHVAVNVLGWMGITVLGTLVTLWPTMCAPASPKVRSRRLAARCRCCWLASFWS